MSLSTSFQIGRSALTASQLALQVTGNNLANAATPGYSRQVAYLTPAGGVVGSSGLLIGQGVVVREVQRQVDIALQSRLQDSISRQSAAAANHELLSQVEAILNELSGSDLSSQLSEFFSAFSELANNPAATEPRALVVEQGATLSSFVRSLRSDLLSTRSELDRQADATAAAANGILSEIAGLNRTISTAEGGQQQNANDLRDRRDRLVEELSTLFEVTTIEQPGGGIDVLVGSTPVVLGSTSRGVELEVRAEGGDTAIRLKVKATGETLNTSSGRLGALIADRQGAIQQTIDELDEVAANLIWQVNRLHSSGRPAEPLRDTTGWLRVPVGDRSVALNDPANATLSGLPFRPGNGSFTVVVTDPSGQSTSTEIDIDLDGIDAAGAPGFGDDTTLDDVVAALDAIPNLNAEITSTGQIRLYTNQGFEVSFGDDTSGFLAAFGINTYFSGTDAADIAVRQELRDNPQLLASGVERGTNESALAIAQLRDAGVQALGGRSLTQAWLQTVERVAVETSGAATRADATLLVRQSLESQRASVSGVDVDEESLNMLMFQRQYQGAARFIAAVDEVLQTLISLV